MRSRRLMFILGTLFYTFFALPTAQAQLPYQESLKQLLVCARSLENKTPEAEITAPLTAELLLESLQKSSETTGGLIVRYGSCGGKRANDVCARICSKNETTAERCGLSNVEKTLAPIALKIRSSLLQLAQEAETSLPFSSQSSAAARSLLARNSASLDRIEPCRGIDGYGVVFSKTESALIQQRDALAPALAAAARERAAGRFRSPTPR